MLNCIKYREGAVDCVDTTLFPLQATMFFSNNRAMFNGPMFARGVWSCFFKAGPCGKMEGLHQFITLSSYIKQKCGDGIVSIAQCVRMLSHDWVRWKSLQHQWNQQHSPSYQHTHTAHINVVMSRVPWHAKQQITTSSLTATAPFPNGGDEHEKGWSSSFEQQSRMEKGVRTMET